MALSNGLRGECGPLTIEFPGVDVVRNVLPIDSLHEIKPGCALAPILCNVLQSLVPQFADPLIVAQKIVSMAEGRYVSLGGMEPSRAAIELADMVACAAGLAMGEGAEGIPAALIRRGIDLDPAPHLAASAIVRPREEDPFQ
ncbi:coenzyme F420-0:L-glutamate ligase [Novosphingobium colocasiae]|uniref:coenzyme F420-0:L-glutamate ligase n=1 Tax=Novosphingobium colocasiae TaxID=1256513 RepID=UPI00227D8927|nr:coenzyme F420-0:L-glutamate ligase [Novosphingobium colocasiae]